MKCGKWFKNQPIKVKLGLINLVTVLIAVVPVVCVTLSYEYYSVRRAMIQNAEAQAEIIGSNVAAATAFADPESAQEILQALHASPDIIQAVLFLPNGRPLASYARSGASPLDTRWAPDAEGSYVRRQVIVVERNVRLKENTVGWLAMETSMQPLVDRLNLYLLVNFFAMMLGFAIAYPLSRRLKESITKPLSDLMAVANQVTTNQDYRREHQVNDSDDEVGKLSRAFDGMLSSIHERDLKLSHMAYYDNVTGLNNRHYFMERLEQVVDNSLRYGTNCCLMFIDLDNFKTVNDTHGHEVGDELLRDVSRALQNVLRDTDVVCRIGGDEFAVIIENNKGMKGPCLLARKIIRKLSAPITLQGLELQIGASIGLASCPDTATNVSDLLRNADTAMYWAKEQGKNDFRVYERHEDNQA